MERADGGAEGAKEHFVTAVVPRGDTIFFPIRHHSPAAALALLRAFDELQPRQVLVEAPVDFEPLLSMLTDPATRPPVAIVSLPAAKSDGEDDYVATYPFCAHSPEFVALSWAARRAARAALIDLPARHPAMRKRAGGDGLAPSLIAEWRLDHNAYVTELCARRGVPDALALWDALFEAQAGTPDWRGFFQSVGLYCRHVREVTDPSEMEADGTLAREAHMTAHLSKALEAEPGPVAVVTGGFHTPALIEGVGRPVEPDSPKAAPAANAYLIRYGFAQLDRFSGYAAGLPHPAYYDRLWHSLQAQAAASADLGTGILTDFADHLRRSNPQFALATPALSAALLAADRLARLRDLPAPGRGELIDAVRSVGVKDALELGRAPLLDALHEFLTGTAIGELPPGAAQPPIVGSVRATARKLGFNLDDGARRTRELDILRRPRHARASRFLFALGLAGASFASRISGPDPLTGWRGEMLFETWTYAWSPMVESELIARAADGQTLEALCLAELARRRVRLAEDGRARSASGSVELLVAAVRTGFARAIERAVRWCAEAVAEDAEPASIIRALAVSAGLARPGPGAPDLAPLFAVLRRQAFERLLLLFPGLVDTTEDQLPTLIRAVAELAALATAGDEAIECERLAVAVRNALAASPPPALDGALAAFAVLIGAMPEEEIAAHIAAMLSGAYVDDGKVAAVLTGCLAVSPRLIVHSRSVLAATDAFLGRIDQSLFLAALPELRLAFSQLTPSEIDRIAAGVAERHGLELKDILDDTMPADEVAENMALSAALAALWREEGLGPWLEDAP